MESNPVHPAAAHPAAAHPAASSVPGAPPPYTPVDQQQRHPGTTDVAPAAPLPSVAVKVEFRELDFYYGKRLSLSN